MFKSRAFQIFLILGVVSVPGRAMDCAGNHDCGDKAQLLDKGRQFEYGEGVTQDIPTALNYYCLASAGGSADAAYEIGWIYANGRGVARDDRLAQRWIAYAAYLGDTFSRSFLKFLGGVPANARVDCSADTGERLVLAPGESMHAVSTLAPGIAAPDSGIGEFVRAWAETWSRQDLNRYFQNYSDAFLPQRGMSRHQWRELRTRRILDARNIQVVLSTIEVKPRDDSRMRVQFVQDYKAEHYRDSVRKALELDWVDGGWKIRREIVLQQLTRDTPGS